jgi:hypothetical protein
MLVTAVTQEGKIGGWKSKVGPSQNLKTLSGKKKYP